MDDGAREIHDGALIIEDNVILHVGTHDELAALGEDCDEIHDLRGHIVIPGMVNTHHHLFQNLTRLIPETQNESLFGWLQTLYPIWMNLRPQDFYISAALGWQNWHFLDAQHHLIINISIPMAPS